MISSISKTDRVVHHFKKVSKNTGECDVVSFSKRFSASHNFALQVHQHYITVLFVKHCENTQQLPNCCTARDNGPGTAAAQLDQTVVLN